MSKAAYYFSHDYNARSDPKMMKLAMKHGMSGLGIYWCVIEMLYEQGGYISLNDIESISYELHSECERIKSVLQDFDLFKFKDSDFYSESVLMRLNKRAERSKLASQSAHSKWDKYRGAANAMRSHSDGNAKKRKEKKEKEIIEDNIYPTFENFWDLYGKKIDGKKCEQKWLKLSHTDKLKCIEALPAYIKATPDKQYRKNPATYLNNRSWENEIPVLKLEPERRMMP